MKLNDRIQNSDAEYFKIVRYLKRYGPLSHHQMKLIRQNPHCQKREKILKPNCFEIFKNEVYTQAFDKGFKDPLFTYLATRYLTFDQVRTNPGLNYCWPYLVRHDIPLFFIIDHWKIIEESLKTFGPQRKERIRVLSSHPQLSNRIIEDNLNLPWDWATVFNRPRFDLKRWLFKVYPLVDKNKELLQAFLGSINLNLELIRHLALKSQLRKYLPTELEVFFRNPLKRERNFAGIIIIDAYRRYRSRKILTTIRVLKKRFPLDIVTMILE